VAAVCLPGGRPSALRFSMNFLLLRSGTHDAAKSSFTALVEWRREWFCGSAGRSRATKWMPGMQGAGASSAPALTCSR
jgi:hypothetical protein